MGLLDPATSDGRVIFFLPWEKMTIAGTTDSPTDVTQHPIPTEEDINFILSEVRNYLGADVEGNPGDPALGRAGGVPAGAVLLPGAFVSLAAVVVVFGTHQHGLYSAAVLHHPVPAPPPSSPLTCFPKCHIHSFLGHLQGG